MTKKISQLPAATSVDTNDEFVINQDGTTKKLTTANQWDFANVNIDGGTIDGTAVNATNLAYSGTLTGGTGVVNLGSGQVYKDASGNVGIGTTNPAARLSVSAESGVDAFEIAGYDVFKWDNSNQLWFGGYRGSQWQMLKFATAGAERMRIDSSGNVGVGTVSPDLYSLNFGKQLTVSTAASGQYPSLLLAGGAGAGGEIDFGNQTIRHGAIASLDGSNLAFYTNSTNAGSGVSERMRIDSSGNVLIGTTAAGFGERLGITQNNAAVATYIDKQDAGTASAILMRHGGSTGATSRSYLQFMNSAFGTVGSIACSGTATVYNTSSDYRLKENIQPLTGALDKVQAMNPVTYDWKAGGKGEGFIAHELQEIAPYAVSGEKDGEDMQGVDYGKLTTLLVGAVKELTAKVEQLEAQLGANNGN